MLLQGYSHVQTGWPVVELKESSRQARSHPERLCWLLSISVPKLGSL